MLNLSSLLFGAAVVMQNPALNPVKIESKAEQPAVSVVKDGKPVFAIVAAKEELAAKQMVKYVGRQTGVEPNVYAKADDVPAGLTVVRIASDEKAVPQSGFKVEVGDGICITGDKPRYGTMWGVYDFMERVFGMRFYYPGPDGTVLPKLADVDVPACTYSDKPRFKNRGTYYMLLEKEKVEEAIGVEVDKDDLDDYYFQDRYAKVDSFTSMHSPFPEEWARANSNKIEIAFFRNPQGHLYYNPKTHAGNYFDVSNLEFADAIIESCKRYYASNGKERQGFCYNDDKYITFGQCDAEVQLEEFQNTPVVKELGLITEENIKAGQTAYFSDIYGRFYKYLGERMEKEFPDKKLVVMPYSSYVLPPFQKKYWPGKNVEVGVCLGKAPRLISNPEIAELYKKQMHDWYVALGNRPVQQLWTYNCGDNIFSFVIATEEMGKFIKMMGETLGDIEVFHEFNLFPAPSEVKGKTAFNAYYATYAGMRAMWNPDFDFEAAIEEHWTPFYGEAAGKHLKRVHQVLREAYFKFVVPTKNVKPLYPPAVLDEISKELDAAEKLLEKGTVEYRRYLTFSKILRVELKSQYGQHAYVLPRADVKRFDGDWSTKKPIPMMEPMGTGDEPKSKPDVRIAWDDKGIYGRVISSEKPLVDEKDMWKGNVIELFLCPGLDQERRFQICFDPLKRIVSHHQILKPIPAARDFSWRCEGLVYDVKLTDDNWTLEFFVPFAGLNVKPPKAYDSWNFCLVYDKGPLPVASTAMNLGNNMDTTRYGIIRFLGLGD